jgi:oligopeptide transport system substrate-binding protein
MRLCALVMMTLLLTFTSCSKNDEIKKTEQLLRANIMGEPATMDPRKGGDPVSSAMHFLLFEGLTRLNQDGKTSLAHAESISVSDDKLTYTFHLRDCQWSNGTPITAKDYEKSWKDILDPSFPSLNAHLLYPIKNAEGAKKGILPLSEVGVRALDEKTLEVVLDTPTPYFLELVSFCVFYPVSHKTDQEHPDWSNEASKNFVSSGPFLLREWQHKNQIILEKNPKYWRRDEIALDSIHFSMIDNEMTALQMYEKGQLDILGNPLSPLPVDAVQELSAKGQLQIRPAPGTTICAFNSTLFPFTNVHIRRAFALAINREAIVKNVTQVDEKPALGAIPPVLKSYKNSCFFKDADHEEALHELELGLKELRIELSDLQGMPYNYSSNELNHKIAQAIQQQWLEVLGIKVKLQNVEHKVMMSKLAKRDFVMAQTIWLAQYNDPMNILERYKFKENIKNYSGWENKEYIALLDKSSTDATTEERNATLEKAEALFIENMPVAPLFHWNSVFISKPYVKNFDMAPVGNGYFEKIYIDIALKEAK